MKCKKCNGEAKEITQTTYKDNGLRFANGAELAQAIMDGRIKAVTLVMVECRKCGNYRKD